MSSGFSKKEKVTINFYWFIEDKREQLESIIPGHLKSNTLINRLSPYSDENEISLYIITTCSNNLESDENKESDHQG